MSIKASSLSILVDKFLQRSEIILNLEEELGSIRDEMKKIIEEDSVRGMTEEELKFLKNLSMFFYHTVHLGEEFGNRYYSTSYSFNNRHSRMITVTLPKSIPVIDNYARFPDFRVLDNFDVLVSLNERFMEVKEKIKDIEDNFYRFINRRTSLVWLRKNLPGVYKYLKEYEESL